MYLSTISEVTLSFLLTNAPIGTSAGTSNFSSSKHLLLCSFVVVSILKPATQSSGLLLTGNKKTDSEKWKRHLVSW
jgi:hypothetical protein